MPILARAYAVFVAGFIGWAMVASLRDHGTAPSGDDTRILVGMNQMSFWEWVFSVQNGHRVPGTLLLFAADYHFFDGRNHLMIVGSIVTLSLALAALWWAARTGDGLESPLSQLVFAAACFGLFAFASCFNLLCGVCHANTAVLLFGFASLGCLCRYAHRRPRRSFGDARYLALSLVAAVLTTVSMGQGIAIWPTLLMLALVMRLPLRVVGVIGLAAAVVGGLAAISIADFTSQFSTASPAEIVLFHPFKLARFTATLIGAGLTSMVAGVAAKTDPVGQRYGLVGMAGLLLFVGHALWTRRHRDRANPHDWLAVGVMGLGAAVAAGIGATRLFTFGFGEAWAPRFFDWSGLFWVGALLSLTAFGLRSRRPALWFAGSAVVVASATAVGLLGLSNVRDPALVSQDRNADASLAILLGSAGPWEFHKFYSGDIEHLHALFDRLRAEKKSLFADPRWAWIGQSRQAVLEIDETAECWGVIHPQLPESIDPRSEWRVTGWAWDASADAPPESVVLVDQRGRIHGLADLLPEHLWPEKGQARWKGWVRFTRKRNRYTAYAIRSDGTACRFYEEPTRRRERPAAKP